MSKKKILIMVMALIFLFVGISNAKARSSRMMRHIGFGMKMVENNFLPARMLLRMKAEIGLTESQVKRIEKMELNYQEFVIKNSADAKLIELSLKAEFNKSKISRTSIQKLIKKIGEVKTNLQINRINYLLDVKSVLTAEQLKKINELRAKRRSIRRKKISSRRGNGRPTNNRRKPRF